MGESILESDIFRDPTVSQYAVFDGAAVPKLLPMLRSHRPEHACLYSGTLRPTLAAAAPYAVRLVQGTPFTDWTLSRALWPTAGVVLTARATLQDIRRHLRKFLMVRTPDGESVYFRFYDPRVLGTFLPVCNGEELAEFFGPVGRFWAAAARPSGVIEFSRRGASLRRRRVTGGLPGRTSVSA
jgi:hypothetical protein